MLINLLKQDWLTRIADILMESDIIKTNIFSQMFAILSIILFNLK